MRSAGFDFRRGCLEELGGSFGSGGNLRGVLPVFCFVDREYCDKCFSASVGTGGRGICEENNTHGREKLPIKSLKVATIFHSHSW